MDHWKPLSEAERARYHPINKDNLEFLINRYNQVNRWVIADMLRRSRYRFPAGKTFPLVKWRKSSIRIVVSRRWR